MLRTGYAVWLLRIVRLMVYRYIRTYVRRRHWLSEKNPGKKPNPPNTIKRNSTTQFKLNLTHFSRVGSPRRSFEMSDVFRPKYVVPALITSNHSLRVDFLVLRVRGSKTGNFKETFPLTIEVPTVKCAYIYILLYLSEFVSHLILF